MAPRIVAVDPATPDPGAIAEAAARLRAGDLVAFPTETVYGLGAHALDPAAVRKIFAAKGRPPTNPVIVHVAGVAAARTLSSAWPAAADLLAERFWPGPLTLVVPALATIPREVTAGLPSVGIRVPAHPVALALLRAAGVPVAAPSANRSDRLSPTTAAHVARSLGEAAGVILDGGPSDVGIESTVLDLTGATPVVLRPGGVTRAKLEGALGSPVGLASGEVDASEARAAPGQMARHYAPRAGLILVARQEVADRAAELASAGRRVAVLVIRAEPPAGLPSRRLPANPAGYASHLYSALHDLDEVADAIVTERPPALVGWEAIHDRLARASA